MKKLLYIVSIMLLGAVACTREAEVFEPTPINDGPKVAVTMSLRLPVEITAKTRDNDRADKPQIDDIHVAVFGTSGYPQAYEKAYPVAAGSVQAVYANENEQIFYFKVLLPVYEGEAHVHVVANGPAIIPWVDETEFSVMSKMETTENVGGYWARVILEDGILALESQDGIMQTDDEGNYIPSWNTAALFKELVLVRNFAEISLEVADEAGISDVFWTLVNDPVSGSMAPMIGEDFVDDYKDYVYDTQTGKMVKGELDEVGKPQHDEEGNVINLESTYLGYMVSTSLNTTIPAAGDITTPGATPLFTYERLDPNKTNPTYIMMKAKYDATGDVCYYRIDLMDEKLGGYFPLYRNYKYQIKINKVGNPGSSTPAEAAKRNSGGNMSMSAETKTLTDVSDGISRLYVEFVEKTYTTGGQKSFWVYYVPDVTDTYTAADGTTKARIDNSLVEVSVKEMGTALADATLTRDETYDTGEDAILFYTFTLNDQDADVDLSSVIEVKASNKREPGPGETEDDITTLYRDLTVKVMKKMDMNLKFEPKKVDAVYGKTTVLHISLSDELQESMFPLEFYIEDTNRSLNPTGYNSSNHTNDNKIAVPVKMGASLYDPSNVNSYCFVRTVEYDEYEPMYEAWKAAKEAGESTDGIIDFTTEFTTIKSNSKTTVYVDNEYFNMQHLNLFNDVIDVTWSAETVEFYEKSVTINIQAESQTTSWEAVAGSGVTLSKTSGTGDATITMSFAENQSFDTDRTYTATITSGDSEYIVTVTQKARSFYVSIDPEHVAYDATSATVEIIARDTQSWTASVDNGATLSATSGSGEATITVTFSPNTDTEVKTYTVTVTAGSSTKTVTVEQGVGSQSPYVFAASAFTISDFTSTVASPEGYVTVYVTNASKGVSGEETYLKLGRTSAGPQDGTITVTPHDGMHLKKIKVTYVNATDAGIDTGAKVSSGTYSVDTTTGIGTWTGNSSSAVTITNSHRASGSNYTYPKISSIEVTYE